ncbi:MAG: hypothetical protein ACKVH8_01035 [Pirellulales bacterium]|jgi:hypothetical protein
MAYGHTDDVPNTADLEATQTPESSAVLHEFKESGAVILKTR